LTFCKTSFCSATLFSSSKRVDILNREELLGQLRQRDAEVESAVMNAIIDEWTEMELFSSDKIVLNAEFANVLTPQYTLSFILI